MDLLYMIEETRNPIKPVYRRGGVPYFAQWSEIDRKWVDVPCSSDYERRHHEKVFFDHDDVDIVTEEEALKQVEINNSLFERKNRNQ